MRKHHEVTIVAFDRDTFQLVMTVDGRRATRTARSICAKWLSDAKFAILRGPYALYFSHGRVPTPHMLRIAAQHRPR